MLLKTPIRIFEAFKCHISGHAHCKKVSHNTPKGPVVDCIVHHLRGQRVIECIPRDH